MLFWILAVLMTLLAALYVISPILRGRRDTTLSAASDLAVYRDQLRELDADVARGILSGEEAESSRTEISRRLLAADARQSAQAAPAPKNSNLIAIAALSGVLIGGALLIYSQIGAPGTPDQPLAERLTPVPQAEAERLFAESRKEAPRELDAREVELLEQLRDVLKERPDDLTGHQLLVQTLNSIEDFAGASAAQDDVLRILGDTATSDDYAYKAELMIFAAGGYVSPEAEQALSGSLQRDPTNARARYYSGISMAQIGKPELAMNLWASLLSEGDADAPWKEPVREQMRQLSASTGLSMPQASLSGPTQGDINAASDMSDEDRQSMIRGMVDGLSDRLATEGGSPAEWSRLITALGVLGDRDQAQAIYDEAQNTFAQNDDALSMIKDAATKAGLE